MGMWRQMRQKKLKNNKVILICFSLLFNQIVKQVRSECCVGCVIEYHRVATAARAIGQTVAG